MLISEAYREQNAQLHSSPRYGVGGAKWASWAITIAHRENCASILDYGCGKGEFKKSIQAWDVLEYDPAIPGKGLAQTADLVVCTDVLEHIEPEYLDSVLDHLKSVTGKILLFCISNKLAKTHTLPDGRNPHLSFHDSEWWKRKLSENFNIIEWHVKKTSCYGEALPLREVGKITSISAMDDRRRNENVRRNCKAISKRVMDGITPHNLTANLVCYGPSLKKTWPALIGKEDVYCVGASHQFLIDRNIIPYAMIDCDPRSRNVEQMGNPHKDVRYWLASCVDPSYLKKLEGHDVALWHIHNGQVSADFVWSLEPDAWLLIGGGSVGLRAISLLYARGYRNFSIHGMDSSYDGNVEYAGEHVPQANKKIIDIRCHDRWFKTNPSLVDYARQFLDDMRLWEGTKFELHGDGLLQEMCKC